MTIQPADIYGWSGHELLHGDVALGLVPQLGGRIMSLKFRGEELLYIPASGRGSLPELPVNEDIAAFKARVGFRIFGGDKTWVAPEFAWVHKCPPVDLDAAPYTFEAKDGVGVMTSPVCRETGLQVVRRVGMMESGDIFLFETLRNGGTVEVSRGVWNVTQVARPFSVLLPVAEGGLRSYHLEDTTLPDPDLDPVVTNGWTTLMCQGNTCFKFGAMLREGRCAVLKDTANGRVIWARVFDIAPGQPYAHRSMVEVFNSHLEPYGECEVHSPLATLAPGAEITLSQLWRVYLS